MWTRSGIGQVSVITVGFRVSESTSSYGDELRRQIGEILVNFPEGFIHQIDSLAYVQVSRVDDGSGTSVSPGMNLQEKWLDFTQKDRLRVQIHSNGKN